MTPSLHIEARAVQRDQLEHLLRHALLEEHWLFRARLLEGALVLLGGALAAQARWPLALGPRFAVLAPSAWCILAGLTAAARLMALRARRRLVVLADASRRPG